MNTKPSDEELLTSRPDEPSDPEAGDGPPTLRHYRRVVYTDPATLINPSHPSRQTDPYDSSAEA